MTVASCDDSLVSQNSGLNHSWIPGSLVSSIETIYDCRNRKWNAFIANCWYHLAIS